MFCEKCGCELEEGSLFCTNCGAKIENLINQEQSEIFEQQEIYRQQEMYGQSELYGQPEVYGQPEIQGQPGMYGQPNFAQQESFEKTKKVKKQKQPKKKGGKKVFAIIGTILASLIIIAIGALLLGNHFLNKECNELMDSIEKYNIPEISVKADDYNEDFEDSGIFNFIGKKNIVKKLEKLEKTAKESDSKLKEFENELKEMLDAKEQYNLVKSYTDYEKLLEECNEVAEKREVEETEKLLSDAKKALEELIEENEEFIQTRLEEYESADMSLATKEEVDEYKNGIEKIEALLSEKKYNEVESVLSEIDNTVAQYIKPEKYLNISVQQVDVSEFPNIKIYTRVLGQDTGSVPTNLDNTLFFIRKKDANANYVKQVISKVTQLNQEESLKIDMVADISGSMEGRPLSEAKTIMSNFIRSVQFDAGDEVELTSFSTGVYIEEEFSNNPTLLINKINNLRTGDMTSLYDALYASVIRVAAQSGAKCVIAFTDGMDNYSSCSSNDVITIAKRYHVPIFIIGIGIGNDYNANSIATQTGGKYYSVYDVNSMEDIYKEIYREQKELYLIEFKDDNDDKISETTDIIVGYNSKEYGGNCNFSYTPNILLSVDGSNFYKDGPEAVVESYMKNFDDAMTNCDFSYISSYLKEGSNIYKTQEKYVQKGISETLVSYEVVDVTYNNTNECIVTTRETFYVQGQGEPLSLMTQQCKYLVVNENNQWKMTDFAGSVEVLSKINQ